MRGLFGLILLGLTWAGAAQAQGIAACGAFAEGTAQLICICQPGAPNRSVWGSDPYTGDSDICTAARHAGRLTANGGAVQVFGAPGQASYAGTAANGVSTGSWNSYGYSFTFTGAGGLPNFGLGGGGAACTAFPQDQKSYSCACPPAAGSTGSVWGSGPYTADSDLCTAARHAGLIGAEGGPITALALDGLGAYAGSEWHGITTGSWGAYGLSITFDANQR